MSKLTRRDMLKTAAAASTAAVVSWFGPRTAVAETNSLLPPAVTLGTFSYFTQPEIAFLDAALSRLIPADALG